MKQSTKNAWKNSLPYILIGAAIFFLDHLIKVLIKTNATSLPIELTSFASITYSQNTGIAFGLLQNTNNIIILTILVIFGALWYFRKELLVSTLSKYAVALIVGGALGNLLDRLMHGAVIDYIQISIWPVFNFADSAITVGMILLLYSMLKSEKQE